MTFQTYLKINGTALPVQKDDYSIDYSDVVADSGGVTEAGTTIRAYAEKLLTEALK